MKRWDKHDTAQCPHCDHEVEDTSHVWKCRGKGADETWEKSIDELHSWLTSHDTESDLAAAICKGLRAWYNNEPLPTSQSTFPGLADAVDNQNKIGWQALLEGCPAKGWEESQQMYFSWIGSRRTGKRWLSAVIRKLWDVAWDMWDHRN